MNKLVVTFGLSLLFAVILSEVTASVIVNHRPLGIIGGSTAEDGEFPYMVQLMDAFNYLHCGGTIIGDKWILTSGSCLQNSVKVVYGTNELAAHKKLNNTRDVKQTYLHPLYAKVQSKSGRFSIYDAGIIELDRAIPLDALAQPVKLADADAPVPFHQDGILSGWGVNDKWGVKPMKTLQKLTLQLLNDEECRQKISKRASEDIFNSITNVCSNDDLNGQCTGDAGSPFVVDGVQYGVTSWSLRDCGTAPGLYTRLTTPAIREFIKNVTGI